MYPYAMEYNNFYFYLLSEDNAFLQKKPFLKITGNFIYNLHKDNIKFIPYNLKTN
jgi:hypothetical protein